MKCGHPLPRHDGQRAVQGLAAVPGVRVAHLPRVHAQLRDLRRLGVRVPRALRARQGRVPRPGAARSRHRAHPDATSRARSSCSTTSCRRAATTRATSCGASSKIDLKNPIGFEFFKPPHEEFYEFLNEHLNDYSVEISVESHDDDVRAAFGKKHYTMDQVEEIDRHALKHGCSALRPVLHDRHPDADRRVGPRDRRVRRGTSTSAWATTRGCCASSSPMAPFLDPGSLAFDNPEEYGYTLRARDARGAPPAAGAAVVEAHHELRERRDDPRRDGRRDLRGGHRHQPRQGRERHHRRQRRRSDTETPHRAARDRDGVASTQIMDGPAAERRAARSSRSRPSSTALSRVDRLREDASSNWPHGRSTSRTSRPCAGLFVRENVRLTCSAPAAARSSRAAIADQQPVGASKPSPGPCRVRAARQVAEARTDDASLGAPTPGDARPPSAFAASSRRSPTATTRSTDSRASASTRAGAASWSRRRVSTPTRACSTCAPAPATSRFAIADQGRPAEVVATDFTPEMLEVAEKKAAAHHRSDQCSFSSGRRPGPAVRRRELRRRRPSPSACATCPTARAQLPRGPPRAQAGRAATSSSSSRGRPSPRGAASTTSTFAACDSGSSAGLLTGDRAGFVYLNDSIRAFPAQPALAAELRDAGFSPVGWKNLTGGIVAIHTAVK